MSNSNQPNLYRWMMISFAIKVQESVKLNEIKKKFNGFMKIHSSKNPVIKYVLTDKYYKILFAKQYEGASLKEGQQILIVLRTFMCNTAFLNQPNLLFMITITLGLGSLTMNKEQVKRKNRIKVKLWKLREVGQQK
ncbi:transmembrane protein, putative (macronuclear) [Tetrahymena thermophila SB210]|uniref:Transmembrane protein, putative n=1 Tax=Tetrahymena thermophila (strain SB210) TaxID=312017 RepID=I7LXV4_TETTS|nr:transmembrane protein, putative [Tetrahymena thermophila SB210]EAS06264.1 transmembrane protein, putative [Tetrahymena thermophila SB210]|eukprot:XP_001026509.1 transmembrane protein, putative [Tetrahymena thermophila SB210]